MRKVLPKIFKTIGKANKLVISIIILGFLIAMGGQSSNTAFALSRPSDNFPSKYAIGMNLPDEFCGHEYCVTGIAPVISCFADETFGPGFCFTDQGAIVSSNTLTPAEKLDAVQELRSQRVGLGRAVSLAIYQVLDQQPSSALIFAEQQVERFQNADVVYAQQVAESSPYFPGTGQEMLAPIQNFWGWAVTLSYSALVLITIAVAVMLIFGDRLGGKQRVTLNAAIQGIVLAMILIPLSYPLAGLFIDLTTLGSNTVRGILIGPGGPASGIVDAAVSERSDDKRLCSSFSTEPCTTDGTVQTNPRGLYADDPNLNFINARDKIGFYGIGAFFQGNAIICGDGDADCQQLTAADGLFGLVNGLVQTFFGGGIGAILGSIVFTILNLAMLLVGIRIGIILIKKYLWMLFAPILMPFSFILMAVPGAGAKVAFDWLKRMAAGAAVFVLAYGMILFAVILSSANFMQDIAGGSITYRYIPPLFGGTFLVGTNVSEGIGQPDNITYTILIGIIGMGIYFAIPSTLNAVAKKIEPSEGFSFPGVKNAWTEFRSATTPVARYGAAVTGGAARAAAIAPRSFLNREGGFIANRQKELNDEITRLNRIADQGGVRGEIAKARAAALTAAGAATLSGIAGKSVDVGVPRGKEGAAEFEVEIKPDAATARKLTGSGESYEISPEAYLALDTVERGILAAISVDRGPDQNGVFVIDREKLRNPPPNVVSGLTTTLNFELKLKPAADKNSRAGYIHFGKPTDSSTVVALFQDVDGDYGKVTLPKGGSERGGLIVPSSSPYFSGRDDSPSIDLQVKFDIVNQVMRGPGLSTFSLSKKIEVYVGPVGASKDQMTKREINLQISVPIGKAFRMN